jgi:dihydroxyacetone kinase
MLAIMKRLLDDPQVSMSDVVYESYHATLHRWHGFIASSAFKVRGCQCNGTGQLVAAGGGAGHGVCWAGHQKQFRSYFTVRA